MASTSGCDEMEGHLHVRAKTLNVWKKRRFVLTGSTLQYFSIAPETNKPKTISSLALSSLSKAKAKLSKPTKTTDRMYDLAGCSIKTVHEYLSSRPFTFQVASPAFFLLLHADSMEEMSAWIRSLRAAAPQIDRLPFASPTNFLSPTSTMIKVAAQSSDDDIFEFGIATAMDIITCLQHGRFCSDRLVIYSSTFLGKKQLARGSVLIAVNGHSVIECSSKDVHTKLTSLALPSTLQFLRCRPKAGVLRSQSYESLGSMLKLTTSGTALMGWRDVACEIDGDLFVCARFLSTATLAMAKWSQSILPSDSSTGGSNSSLSLPERPVSASKANVPLAGCSVRLVHEVLAGRPFCFLLSHSPTNAQQEVPLLFQASSQEDMLQWLGALVHAIDLANGVVVGGGVNCSPLPTSMQATHSTMFFPPETNEQTTNPSLTRALHAQGDLIFEKPVVPMVTNDELVRLLLFCQQEARYTEALQVLLQEPAARSTYWPQLFAWGLASPSVSTLDQLEALVHLPISDEDAVQLQKDVPRTASWMASSEGAPLNTVQAPPERLTSLHRILHAFIASTHVQYLQGMNGIAFLLLELWDGDEVRVYQYLEAMVHHILPSIFDASDEVSALVQTGQHLESMMRMYLPTLTAVFDDVGLPVFLLAYKWFPTLFSDVSLQANRKHNQLQYDTLLCIWDICLLMGIEGMYCVSMALFASAEPSIRALGSGCLAEEVSHAFIQVLSTLSRDDLMLHVSEVIETCRHPLLLQWRNAHHRRVHRPIRVKDLDTGQVFGVEGAHLYPLEHAEPQ
ncbi:hypothetical protein SDRG_01592 [Saprolegnia diclina VS20]|uniref:Rab-GAP TBC domain-containing protein n=1 Tax=Saprolegnia diclina (strain VS20) TaxID=1156394 RepID=T0QTX6_SAPDV|nr:hypothetical protein SDRG_01592 [Saprolegnia diclina VS20]EQC41634.1 hypothetical protein SDRG_01592 [Saprolegnia diclina VS20]|eukprot:XP_008605348.1 hypothetical protein SDRG_01592 [Saprolegnia diclina VS20]